MLDPTIVRGGSTRPSSMEGSHKKHRPHIEVRKDAGEEEDRLKSRHLPILTEFP